MLGEANMCYVMGDYAEATQKLRELIMRAPDIPDPYKTLGLIHEQLGQKQMALHWYMLAALISPNELHLWKTLAMMSKEEHLLEQAAFCFTKAANLDPNDMNLQWEKGQMYQKIGNLKKAMDAYKLILRVQKNDLEVASALTKILVEMNDVMEALMVMETTFISHLNDYSIDYTHINILAELYILQGRYEDAVKLIEKEGEQVSMKMMATKQQQNGALDTTVTMPIDLVVKLCICYLRLKRYDKGTLFLLELKQKDPCDYGDLYYDVAETYFDLGKYEEALDVYVALSQNREYNKPTIWLRLAECYRALEDLSAAANAYLAILREFPDRDDIRLTLSNTYEQLGQHTKALQVMEDATTFLVEDLSPVHAENFAKTTRSDFFLLQRRLRGIQLLGSTIVPLKREEINRDYFKAVKIMHQKCNLLYASNYFEEFIQLGLELFNMFRRNPDFLYSKVIYRYTLYKMDIWHYIIMVAIFFFLAKKRFRCTATYQTKIQKRTKIGFNGWIGVQIQCFSIRSRYRARYFG
jgi:tetratricopeptide (TPR) repeat protein